MEQAEANPAQWPSFDHIGIWYCHMCHQRHRALNAIAIYIQRWWRQRGQSRKQQKIYPILQQRRFYSVSFSAFTIRQQQQPDNAFDQMFCHAYEKLDGTNLGVRCDGAVFGRRLRIQANTYQRVPLEGSIPLASQVQSVKKAMLGKDNEQGMELILYGELMCNPGKFDYNQRGMGHKFYCFGAMLTSSKEITDNKMTNWKHLLKQQGFNPSMSSKSGRIAMNHRLRQLLEDNEICCVPLMDKGRLREVCFQMKESMMKDDREGVVLTGDDGMLYKWKTSVEDESQTHSLLSSLLVQNSQAVLKLIGVDVHLVQCFIDVAEKKVKDQMNRVTTTTTSAAARKAMNKEKSKHAAYDHVTLEKALESAISKYDALEAYFEQGQRSTIISKLNKELVNDLGAKTPEEMKCVECAVGKKVGVAFGQWKKKTCSQEIE